MFDCPEQSHTSPTRTSVKVTTFFPEMVRSIDLSLAFSGSRSTRHFPSAPAVVAALFDSSKTGFEIAIGLTGVMSLWLGLMKIAEKVATNSRLRATTPTSGVVTRSASIIRPPVVTTRPF